MVKIELFTVYCEGELTLETMKNLENKLRDFFEENGIMKKIEIENLRTGDLICW